MKQLLVRVIGRVQGVGFRYVCRQQAERLGIHGWVRNCRDGSVEACLQGDERALEAMQLWLQQGPDLARIDQLQIDESVCDRALQTFTVRFDEE